MQEAGAAGAMLHNAKLPSSPWPPDFCAPNGDHVLARSRALVVHDVPVRIKPDHQEPQAQQIQVGPSEDKLRRKATSQQDTTRHSQHDKLWGEVTFGPS